MATSGTVGQKSFDVAQIIEHAIRRCGKVASTITQDQLTIARDNLALILTSMINRGMNLWTIEKSILALETDQVAYTLPVGTIDVLNTFYRTSTEATPTWTVNAANWEGVFTDATAVISVGIVPTTTQTLSLVIESSDDGITWTTNRTLASASYTAGAKYWFDIEPAPTALRIRVRESVAVSLTLTAVTCMSAHVERVLSRINRDDYTNLPNKRSSGAPTQFWFDRQIEPRIWVWSMPSDDTATIVVWRQRDVQDVGNLTDNLEIPSRWSESVIWQLAARLVFELPEVQPDRIQLVLGMADKYDMEAGSEEYDNSPTYLVPNISGYSL